MGVNEITRLEKLLSEFLSASETTRINQNAAFDFLEIDKECFNLIERCTSISKLTQGCFDITVGPLKKLYAFKKQNFEMPQKKAIKNALQHVGYQYIKLKTESNSVFFSKKKMRISFAGIGKGYASDRVKNMWLKEGVTSGYINASGDINTFGSKEDGSPWKIGIANPNEKSKILLHIPANNTSVATSGDYEQYFTYQGQRYSHNLDPHTGMPLTGIKSVTVFSPSAELSDALSTAIYVKGTEEGITFINQLPQTHALIIDDRDQLIFSKKINYEMFTA